MGIGVSILLIAVGAILTWAVNATVSGLELNTIGVILMVVGALGLVLSMIFWSSWGGVAGGTAPARRPTSTTARASKHFAFSSVRARGGPAGRLSRPFRRAAARTRTSSRGRAPTRRGSGRPSGGRARGRCRGRGRCRRRRARGSGRGGRTSRRSAPARRPGSRDRGRAPRSARVRRRGCSSSSTRPPSGEYLTAFSTRLTSTCSSPSASAATCGPGSGAVSTSSTSGRQVRRGRRDHAARELGRVGPADRDRRRAGVEPAREQDVVDDPREPLRLAGDHLEHARLLLVPEHDVVAAQRHRGAVDRGERRAQLVRDGRDEVALQLLDRALVGQVAEGVDRAVRELGGRQREPELTARPVEGEGLLALARLLERPVGQRRRRRAARRPRSRSGR